VGCTAGLATATTDAYSCGVLSNDEIAAFIAAGHEVRNVEFKGRGSTSDSEFVAKVARAAIAMANQRDGGYVIIGVDEADPERCGLDAVLLAEWMDFDTVVDKLNRYADPPVRLSRDLRQLPGGEDVVVLEVAEFDDIPILAARDSPKNVIQLGHLYTRSFRKPESTSTHTHNELREVLDLATQKQLGRFLRTARGAGMPFPSEPSANEQYDGERATFLAQAAAEDIVQTARFEFTLRPADFETERIDFTNLLPAVRAATVSVRGWPFPFVENPDYGDRWISEQNRFIHYEVWAAFESGQYASWHRLPQDLDDGWNSLSDIADESHFFPVWLAVAQFTEVLSFALRYRRVIRYSGPLSVQLRVIGAKGWRLIAGDRYRNPLHGDYRLSTNDWQRTVVIPEGPEGAFSARELAMAPSMHLLRRFGWSGVTEQIIASTQDSAFDGRLF
jgi:hypothetical protein